MRNMCYNMQTRSEPDENKCRTAAIVVQYILLLLQYYLYAVMTVAGYWAIVSCYQKRKYSVTKTNKTDQPNTDNRL